MENYRFENAGFVFKLRVFIQYDSVRFRIVNTL